MRSIPQDITKYYTPLIHLCVCGDLVLFWCVLNTLNLFSMDMLVYTLDFTAVRAHLRRSLIFRAPMGFPEWRYCLECDF